MKKRHLFSILIISCAVYVCVYPGKANAQSPRPEFKIGKFSVQVDTESVSINGRRPPGGKWQPTNLASGLADKVFSGKGKTTIKNIQLAVTFKDVRLKLDRTTLVATTGTVLPEPGRDLQYSIQVFKIQVERQSIQITPATAKAKVIVVIPIAFFSSDNATSLSISSDGCNISSDGSIYGRDFHGIISLLLKDSHYGLRIRKENAQSVLLGTAFSDRHLKSGIKLYGTASREGTEVFVFNGVVYPDTTAIFDLKLRQQLIVYPEIDYVLSLKGGAVHLQYGLSGLQDIRGSYEADITLPPTIKNDAGQTIALKGVVLETNKKDVLYGKLTLPEKLRVGNPFLIEPSKGAVWAYFPKWPLQQGYSSYPDKLKCTDLALFLDEPVTATNTILHNADKRPGLTVLQGILYLTSPQITENGSRAVVVKTPFSGAVTITPWGLTGPLVGLGYSFVLLEQDIVDGSKSNVAPRKTWEQILAARTTHPEEPKERFQIANLRILDMYLKEMRVCMNEIEEEKSTFTYVVHFPFPSFIDLEFEDKTLNRQGLFKHATGPLATVSINIPKEYATEAALNEMPNTLPKGATLTPNPDTYILYAWRLPVSFADRGVRIDFVTGLNTQASVTAVMDTSRQINGNILSSELWLKPLYSANSAIRSGVRFSATMDSQGGDFKLTEWDLNPYLCRMYANPGSEQAVGFLVRLNDVSGEGVRLIDASSNPISRPYDVSWVGGIQFPFFSSEAPDTWKAVSFEIKDLVPKLTTPLRMQATHRKTDCLLSPSGTCQPQSLPDPSLRVEVDQLTYLSGISTFTIVNPSTIPILRAFDVNEDGSIKDLSATSLNMSSYTHAMLTTSMKPPDPNPLDVGGGAVNLPDECARNKWVRRTMKDYQPSTVLRDLVCYDSNATCARRSCNTCSTSYLFGTYEIRTRDCQDLSRPQCAETVILSIPNSKYYSSLNKIDSGSSDISMKSDEMADSHPTVINIPGAQFAFTQDGRFLEGAFGATLSTVAASLPYEGELRLRLDTKCGYYYLQGAGSFTYYVRFSGQNFIVHAPYKFLFEPSIFLGVTDILEDLRIRALFGSVPEFTDAAGLGKIGPNTIISGVLTSGNISIGASIGIAYVGAALGPGAYLYQFKENSQQNYRIGTFSKVRARAGIGVLGFGVGLDGDGTLATGALAPLDLSNLDTIIQKGEFDAKGDFRLTGCAGIIFGHCAGWLDFPEVSYSTSSGFNINKFSPDGECGSGGCP